MVVLNDDVLELYAADSRLRGSLEQGAFLGEHLEQELEFQWLLGVSGIQDLLAILSLNHFIGRLPERAF